MTTSIETQTFHVKIYFTDETGIPQVGDMVHVPKLGKDAKVIQVLVGKKMIVVKSGAIQLKLSITDVNEINRRR